MGERAGAQRLDRARRAAGSLRAGARRDLRRAAPRAARARRETPCARRRVPPGAARRTSAGRAGRAPTSARRARARSGSCMNAWTIPTFWRLPRESDLIGRSSSRSNRSASACAASSDVEPTELREVAEHLASGEVLVEAEVARADSRCGVGASGRDRGSSPNTSHAAAGRPDQVEQEPDRRRLAGAVRPEEAEDLPGLDLEVDGVDTAILVRRTSSTHSPG